MWKEQMYNIHASFLVPAYNMPKDVHSTYLATQRGQHQHGSISIDVWLVNANKENPKQSMVASLRSEAQNYQAELTKALAEEKPVDEIHKSPRVRQLEHGTKLFAQLVNEAGNSVYHKKPDAEFLNIARRNFANQPMAQCQPDLSNYMYLAGLSHYHEI